MKLVEFLNSKKGRTVRMILGLALVVIGALVSIATLVGGIILLVVGAFVEILALKNVCILSPLTKAHSH